LGAPADCGTSWLRLGAGRRGGRAGPAAVGGGSGRGWWKGAGLRWVRVEVLLLLLLLLLAVGRVCNRPQLL